MWDQAANESARLRKFAEAGSLVQRLANTICDHRRVVIDCKRDGALEAVRAGNQQTESSLKRVRSNPSFVRHADMFAAGDDGSLDAFSAMPRDIFNIEDGNRHTASL